MRRTIQGFTLIELMTVVAILAMIAIIAVPSYQHYLKKVRLEKARDLLLENVYFMEQYYARHHRFKKNSTTWPQLPHTATEYFDIRFTSAAKGEMSDGYRLNATPNAVYASKEERFLEVDYHGNVKLCNKIKGKLRCEPY